MATMPLDEDNLGRKHQRFNNLVNGAVANRIPFEHVVTQPEVYDIDYLFKIDIACRYRNASYILEVFKSEDMIHVSRAIRESAWLITDTQYAHIINPEYLNFKLFSDMMSKAICKLLLHIRLTLKDPSRNEEFFNYYERTDLKLALKWLQNCSVRFIEMQTMKHLDQIEFESLKRLMRQSFTVFQIYIEGKECFDSEQLTDCRFLLYNHTERYLDILETIGGQYWPQFGPRHTAHILRNSPERMFNNFHIYAKHVHLTTIGKHLGPDKTREFFVKLAEDSKIDFWFSYKAVEPLIKLLPKEGRLDLLKKTFIGRDEKHSRPRSLRDAFMTRITILNVGESEKAYQLYRHAPFIVAFKDLKEHIKIESSPEERGAILRVMLTTAGQNANHIKTLLQYYYDRHVNETFNCKINFINAVISKTRTHSYDNDTWGILNQLFHSVGVYIESDKNVQTCLEAIIVYKVLRNEGVPDVVLKKFKFKTLKDFQSRLDEPQKEVLFQYLYGVSLGRLEMQSLDDLNGFRMTVHLLGNAMDLLKDWDKELPNYPSIINKIKEVVNLKCERGYNYRLRSLYNKNKSWKRYMFEESLYLCSNEDACNNALKHDPGLFQRHAAEIERIQCDDRIKLWRLLSKLRIYWSESLAENWANAYRNRINQTHGHKALIRGLCVMLPREELLELFEKYAPGSGTISWGEIGQVTLSLRKNFARMMHHARPQPPLDAIMLYAHGDYLQYALPSLVAIFHNMSSTKSRVHLPKLLDGSVSLQQHVICLAFAKIEAEELKNVLTNIWRVSSNTTARTVIFQQTFNSLCREVIPSNINKRWDLLKTLIDGLTDKEASSIYDLLGNVDRVPKMIRADFCMKSYVFLKTLPPEANCGEILDRVVEGSAKLLDVIDPHFATTLISEFIDEWLTKKRLLHDGFECYTQPLIMRDIICGHLLYSADESIQNKRFDNIFKPILNICLESWDRINVRRYFLTLILTFVEMLNKHLFMRKYVVPLSIFVKITDSVESHLPIDENYSLITLCKLTVCYVETYNSVIQDVTEAKSINEREEGLRLKVTPKFAVACGKYLNEEMDRHFPLITHHFASALKQFVDKLNVLYNRRDEFKVMFISELLRSNQVPLFLVAIKMLPKNCEVDVNLLHKVHNTLLSHPSIEVRMHYWNKFSFEECYNSVLE